MLSFQPGASARYIPQTKWDVRAGYIVSPGPYIGDYSWLAGNRALYQMYDGYLRNVYHSGGLYADIGWSPRYWLTVHVSITDSMYWGAKYDSMTDKPSGNIFVNQLSVMPGVRFQWSVGGIVMLHAGVGFGLGLFSNSKGFSDVVSAGELYSPGDMSLQYQYEVVPIGVRVGKRLYGFADITVGSTGSGSGAGFRAGIGYGF